MHDGFGVAEIGTTAIHRWRGVVNQENFVRQRDSLEALASRYPGTTNLVVVVEQGSTPPDAELRKLTMDMVAKLEDRIRSIAVVIEGSGFKTAAIRSVLSGMALLRKVKTPVMFSASLGDAASWVVLQCPSASADDIRDAHERLKQSMG